MELDTGDLIDTRGCFGADAEWSIESSCRYQGAEELLKQELLDEVTDVEPLGGP